MSDDAERFVQSHLARRLERAGVEVGPPERARLLSVDRLPPASEPPAGGDDRDSQRLVRFEVGLRRGDISVQLNGRDGELMSWLYTHLAEGSAPAPNAQAALQAATAAAAPPPDAVLASAGFETLGGQTVFVAHWDHVHEGVRVERDFIRALVSGRSGRVFAVHRHWHDVDFDATER
jgi:hypothetical protein